MPSILTSVSRHPARAGPAVHVSLLQLKEQEALVFGVRTLHNTQSGKRDHTGA